MNQNYLFDHTLANALIDAKKYSENAELPCINTACLLLALYSESESSVYKMLSSQGLTYDDIVTIIATCLDSLTYLFDFNQCFYTIDLNQEKFNISENVLTLIDTAYFIFQKVNKTDSDEVVTLTVDDALVAFSYTNPKAYSIIMTELIFSNKLTKKRKSVEQRNETNVTEKQSFVIPEELSSFLTVINDSYSSNPTFCPICGREKELTKIWITLAKKTKRNCVLTGPAGVGKSAIAEKLTWSIATGNCPEIFKNCIVLSLDVNSIIAGTTYRGTAEKRFQSLIAFLEQNPNCILFIDEMHLLLGAGSCKDNDLDLANALKPLLAKGVTKVIGATTDEEYQKYICKDSALKRRFEEIKVKEPKHDEVYPMIKNKIKLLEEIHGTTITPEVVDNAILLSSCFKNSAKNPDKVLDVIDQAMAKVQLFGNNPTKNITKADILDVFDVYTEKFKNMTEKQKMQIAYHEAGHYLVSKFAKELTDIKSLAISIMPAEDYLGILVFDFDSNVIPNDNLDYFIANISWRLAGRIAEKMYSSEITSGASKDLESATSLAKNVVRKFGLVPDFKRTIEKDDLTPEIATKVQQNINDLLHKAEIRAQTILNDNHIYLDILANELCKKGILTEKEINKLFEKKSKKLTKPCEV